MAWDEDFQREANLERFELDRLRTLSLPQHIGGFPDPSWWNYKEVFGGKYQYGAVPIQTGGYDKIVPLKPYVRATDPALLIELREGDDAGRLSQQVDIYDSEIAAAEAKKASGKTSKGLDKRLRIMKDKRQWHAEQLMGAEAQLERQGEIARLRESNIEIDTLASRIEEAAREQVDMQRQIWILNESPNYRSPNSSLRPIVEGLKRQQEMHANTTSLGPNLLKWRRLMESEGLNSADWLGRGGINRYLLAAPIGAYGDLKDAATFAKVGPFKHLDSEGNSYTDSEIVESEGINFTKESIDYYTKYLPDNKDRHPEISHEQRWKFFDRNGPTQNPYKSEAEAKILDGYEQGAIGRPLPFQNVPQPPTQAIIGPDMGNFDSLIQGISAP